MKRAEYLERCQKCGMWTEIGAGGILKNLPDDCIIVYKDNLYYPMRYMLGFDKHGNPVHSVIIHDIESKGCVIARLNDVRAKTP